MLRRFLVLFVLAVVLFVLANTVAHAIPDALATQPIEIHLETSSPALLKPMQ